LQRMPVLCQANSHTGIDAANDPTLMAIRRMGLDILGPFPRAVGGYQYLYVTIAIDKIPPSRSTKNLLPSLSSPSSAGLGS
jgi:hypothetical protein